MRVATPERADPRAASISPPAGFSAPAPRPAVFIDKDGSLVHAVPHDLEAERVCLRSDAGVALSRLGHRGYAVVLVSNQPGVAQGVVDPVTLEAVWERLTSQLSLYRVSLAGVYYCPHHPAGRDPRYARECDCRKPQAGLLHRAAAELGLDLASSWLIGRLPEDIEAGRRAGCRTVLLDASPGKSWRGEYSPPDHIAPGLTEATAWILARTAPRHAVEPA